MHKLQEQTVTQIIIPFVQMIIPFSHLWNGKKKKKGEALLILEYRKVTRFDYKSWWSISNNSNAVVTLKLRLQSFFFLFFFLQWINRNENCVIIAP